MSQQNFRTDSSFCSGPGIKVDDKVVFPVIQVDEMPAPYAKRIIVDSLRVLTAPSYVRAFFPLFFAILMQFQVDGISQARQACQKVASCQT